MAPPVAKKKKRSSANRRPISTVGQTQPQPMGSFWTPFGGRKSVRLAHKTNKPLKEISICNDVWWNILPFFGRSELGLKLALLSPRFNWLVDKHFNAKTTELTIWRTIEIQKDKQTGEAKFSVQVKKRKLMDQLPECPMPIRIRFMDLRISHIDYSVITFFRTNKKIFNNGTKLTLDISNEKRLWDVFVREIWPIFAANILRLDALDDFYLKILHLRLLPTFLTDLKQLNTIDSSYLFPDAIADDRPNPRVGQALAKWLQTPTTNGQPKRLRCKGYYGPKSKEWFDNIKKGFLSATGSARYIIQIKFYLDGETTPTEFELVNERTHEKLSLAKDEEVANHLISNGC